MRKRIHLLILAIMLCIVGGVSQNQVSKALGATFITIGKTVSGNLESGASDYYSFTPSVSGQMTITITGKAPAGLTADLMDKNDKKVYRTKSAEYNSEKGYETMKYVVYVDPIPYHIRISGLNTSAAGKYTIKTSFKALKDTDPLNHTKSKAYPLSNNKYYRGYITIDNTKDYYTIKVKSGENLKFTVNCYSDSSVTVGIIKPSEKYVSLTGTAGFNNYTYDVNEKVSAGTYMIVISGTGGKDIEEGRYYSISTGNYVKTKSIKTITEKTMYVGKTYSLKVTRTPSNSTEKLSYTSSKKSVVTVSSTGKLTAKAKGTATITIKGMDTGIKKTVKVTVKEIAVSKVQITTASKSIYRGGTLKLTAKVTPYDATHRTVTWKSSNTSVATVTRKGTVTGKGAGSCTITATAGGKKATYKVTVKSIPVSSVSLNTSSTSVYVGNTVTLKATVSPSNAANRSVSYTSSNTSVATVSGSGVVTGKNAGTCTITASAGGKKATCTIKVKEQGTTNPTEPVIKSITMESSVRLSVGDTKKLSVTISPSDASTSGLTWTSSDSSVVSVNNGTITCAKAGFATIVVKAANGVSAMCTVYVSE